MAMSFLVAFDVLIGLVVYRSGRGITHHMGVHCELSFRQGLASLSVCCDFPPYFSPCNLFVLIRISSNDLLQLHTVSNPLIIQLGTNDTRPTVDR